jgi:hypothetical protein
MLVAVLLVCSLVVLMQPIGCSESFLIVSDRPIWALVSHEAAFLQSREDRTDSVRIQSESIDDRCGLPRTIGVVVEDIRFRLSL